MRSLRIEHLYSECQKCAMLVPFGLFKNAFLKEIGPGDELVTIDDPPAHLKIKHISVIPTRSTVTDSICMLIYGYPIETVLKAMRGNWAGEIYQDKLYFIVYEYDHSEDFTPIPEEATNPMGCH
jgi:hypothetical protein